MSAQIIASTFVNKLKHDPLWSAIYGAIGWKVLADEMNGDVTPGTDYGWHDVLGCTITQYRLVTFSDQSWVELDRWGDVRKFGENFEERRRS